MNIIPANTAFQCSRMSRSDQLDSYAEHVHSDPHGKKTEEASHSRPEPYVKFDSVAELLAFYPSPNKTRPDGQTAMEALGILKSKKWKTQEPKACPRVPTYGESGAEQQWLKRRTIDERSSWRLLFGRRCEDCPYATSLARASISTRHLSLDSNVHVLDCDKTYRTVSSMQR